VDDKSNLVVTQTDGKMTTAFQDSKGKGRLAAEVNRFIRGTDSDLVNHLNFELVL
jgi:hypothetical protein